MDAILPTLSSIYRGMGITAFAVMAIVGMHAGVFAASPENGGNFSINQVGGVQYPPENFDNDIKPVMDAIKKNLALAQCGGWDRNTSVGNTLGLGISKVTGAPGREGEPLGNLESGMAKRNDTFLFPAGANGMVTACKNATDRIDVKVYCPGDPPVDGAGTPSRNCTQTVKHPFFTDPHACLWRGGDEPLDPPLTAGQCNGFCTFLNDPAFMFSDCKKVEKVNGAWKCTQMSMRWTCSDEWVDSMNANCKQCHGGTCRCPGGGCEISKAGTPYRSFFRRYSVSTSRQALTQAPKDLLTQVTAKVQCYGFYQEFDAKTRLTYPQRDQRCVIAEVKTSGMDYDRVVLRSVSQKGKGKYMMDTPPPDKLPDSRPYDPKTDIWFTKIMGAFSFLKPKEDLTTALLTPEKAKLQAGVQNTDAQPWMAESILRSVDDTASTDRIGFRPFTAWWQKFVGDAQAVFTPPIVRLRLPATWNQSIAALNPIGVTPLPPKDRRNEAIEVQLQAKDDIAGVVADQLKRALMLDVREEPVPIVVPLGSPVEFRGVAQQWEEWRNRRMEMELPVPGEVDRLITKLQQYATQIESVRALRAQLPLMFAAMLEKESDFLVGINDWVEQNRKTFGMYVKVAQDRETLKPLWSGIAGSESRMSDATNFPWCKNDRFTTPIYSLLDPWMPGRPDLYGGTPTCIETPTPPVIVPGGGGSTMEDLGKLPDQRTSSLPILCVTKQEKELIYDLSQLRVTTGSILLPVIKPIQVRLKLPKPGPLDQDIADPSVLILPDLPEVPDITDQFEKSIPQVKTLSVPRSLPPPVVSSLPQLQNALARAGAILSGMNGAYDKFWRSLEYLDPDSKEPPKCYTRNGEVIMQPLDCCGWGDARCAHTEVDLIERFTRISARPAILLKEDLQVVGPGQTDLPRADDHNKTSMNIYANCTPADLTCQPLLPVEEPPADGWQVIFPQKTQDLLLDTIRKNVREYSLSPTGAIVGKPPLPFITNATDLYESFNVPGTFDLRAPKAPPKP